MKKIAVVYVTYDGAVNSASGVGVLSRHFVAAFPKVANKLTNELGLDISFHIVAVRLTDAADGYSADIMRRSSQACAALGGQLHLVENGLNGEKGYGQLENWQLASQNAVTEIGAISETNDHTYVYLVDTPFLNLPEYYSQTAKVTYLIVPHSDVYSHTPDNIDRVRQKWEKSAFSAVGTRPDVFLAETSCFLLKSLRAHYKFEDKKIIALQTGIVPADKRYDRASETEIIRALENYNIPQDKELLFSAARAVPYKGFDDLISAYAILAKSNPNVHLVFLAPPHRGEDSEVSRLQGMIDNGGLSARVTSIYHLDMELPRLICQWKNTKIVAQLSHREPFGLVPEEVRLWGRASGPVNVASNLDGFMEQITDGIDGFLVDPRLHEQVAATFARVLARSDREINLVKKAGYDRCLSDYDYTSSVESSFRQLLAK